MKTLLKNSFLLVLTLTVVATQAQDIIIKNDRTEIKSKVIELTDSHVKYKKWENIDGPVYNLTKAEVFMILYANGQREIMEQNTLTTPPQRQNNMVPSPQKAPPTQTEAEMPSNAQPRSLQDWQREKVNYRPTRLLVGLQSPFEFGCDTEFRLIRNFLNIGVTYIYGFPKDDNILGTEFGSLYGSVYLPINRLLKNYENQDKGLFIFCNTGLALNSISIFNSKTLKSDKYFSDFYASIRLGADYYFTKGFGFHLSTQEFKTFYIGISSKI